MNSVYLEALPSPFGAVDQPTTLATPSCCCCCCCCLVSISTTTALLVVDANDTAKAHNRTRWIAVVAVLAVFPVVYAAAQLTYLAYRPRPHIERPVFMAMAVVGVLWMVAARMATGQKFGRGWLFSPLVLLVGVIATVAEAVVLIAPAALLDSGFPLLLSGLLELSSPLACLGAVRLLRSRRARKMA
jgi:hypothetical protein